MACYNMCTANYCTYNAPPNEVWNYNGSGTSVTPGCSSNSTFPDSAGDPIYDENMDRLAGSINDERARRAAKGYPHLTPFVFDNIDGSEETTGTVIYGSNATQERMKDIKTAINQIAAGYVTYSTTDGTLVPWSSVREARDKINALRAACLCNSDCGPNTICACHVDCTCNTY